VLPAAHAFVTPAQTQEVSVAEIEAAMALAESAVSTPPVEAAESEAIASPPPVADPTLEVEQTAAANGRESPHEPEAKATDVTAEVATAPPNGETKTPAEPPTPPHTSNDDPSKPTELPPRE
jgi:hypothetical protein